MPSRKTKPPAPVVSSPPAPAMRLIFEYDGDEVRLISQQAVDMVVTGADLSQVYAAGTFVDARDATGRTLARVHARGVAEDSIEVFPEKQGESIQRVPVERRQGAFTVVLPAPQAAARVAVVRVQPAAADRDAARATPDAARSLQSTELASFPLQPQR